MSDDLPIVKRLERTAAALEGSIAGTNAKQAAALIRDLVTASTEYLAAGENSITTRDDVSAMIRFADAETALRAALSRAKGEK
jgi:S-adenosylhomocysteine hydrolase